MHQLHRRPSVRQSLTPSVVIALVLFSGVALGAALLVETSWFDDTTGTPAVSLTLVEILQRNTGAAMLLYSGVATLGLSAVLGLLGVSAYVGVSLRIVIDNGGLASLLRDSGSYVVFEFAGIVLAAAAGLHPLLATIRQRRSGRHEPLRVSYATAVLPSLGLLALSIVLILVGAVVEAAVISGRS